MNELIDFLKTYCKEYGAKYLSKEDVETFYDIDNSIGFECNDDVLSLFDNYIFKPEIEITFAIDLYLERSLLLRDGEKCIMLYRDIRGD